MPAVADTMEADALALLGIPRHDGDTAFDHIRRGLPTSVIDRLAEALGIARRELLALAAIAPATLNRRRRTQPPRLSATESDRIYRIADVLARPCVCLKVISTPRANGSPSRPRRWAAALRWSASRPKSAPPRSAG
jgi:hypothetical protein